jgi:tetratricopeptide (TPR) repeat protein
MLIPMRQGRTPAGTAKLRLFSAALLSAALLAGAPAAARSIDEAIALHSAGRLREALRAYRTVAAATAVSDPAVAAAALNNACVLLGDLGDFRAALPDCREALRLRRALDDPAAVAETLNNLGLTLEALGRPAEAEPAFRAALALNRRLGDAEAQAINLGNLAALALTRGGYSEAMRLYRQAGDLAARHGGEPWAAEQRAIARINQGVVLEKMGAFREALDLYKELLAGSEALEPRRRAALLVNAGVIQRNLGDPVSAVAAFREAVDFFRRTEDLAGLSNAFLNLGLALHLNLERPDEAEAAYREALRLARTSGDRTEEIQDLFYLGRLLVARGRLAEAEAVFQQCLRAAQESGSAEGQWSAREGLGRTAAARGDLAGALAHFERALHEIERVRAGLAREGWRAGYFGDKRAVYAATVDVLWRMERRSRGRGAARALEVVQGAKARDLLDALGAGRAPAAPLRAAEIRERAGEGTVLEYFFGEDHLYLWTIRRSGLRMADLGPKRPVLDAVLRVHRSLARGAEPPSADVGRLSRILLTAAEPGELLHIAPDGLLHYLPFEILERSGIPLIEKTAVVYLSSASVLGLRRTEGGGAPLRLIGLGAPLRPRTAVPLPATTRELTTIARLLGGRSVLLLGERATEEAFRSAMTRRARVVHLATHTTVAEGPGGGAAILLSPSGKDDGLLHPAEIAGLRARCDLAVLAACRTALGSGEEGRALASLTGSFLAAGSPSVVATLWDVGDASTAVFMEQLYAQLGRGRTPAEALRRAKLRLRADPRWNRPSLWAGYVLVGDGPRVAPRRWPWGAAILVLLGLGGLVALRLSGRRARRSRS